MGIMHQDKGYIYSVRFGKQDVHAPIRRWLLVLAVSLCLMILISFRPSFSGKSISRFSAPYSSRRMISSSVVREPSSKSPKPYFLTAVIFNRVFEADKFGITDYECKQWIEYMLYAGVEHIYWYDTAHGDDESQEEHLKEYVKAGLMTYHRFYHIFAVKQGSDFHYEQDNSYQHFLDKYRDEMKWVVEMDVDEYPFMPSDTKPKFLKRFLKGFQSQNPTVSQILVQCMIFAGNPEGDVEQGWIIELYQKRKHQTEGNHPGFYSRQKPIFQAKLAYGVSTFDPHSFRMKQGATQVAEPSQIRMNHYWGARFTDFGPDTPELLDSLMPDKSMDPIASTLRNMTALKKVLE